MMVFQIKNKTTKTILKDIQQFLSFLNKENGVFLNLQKETNHNYIVNEKINIEKDINF
jgi:hypothetical protein